MNVTTLDLLQSAARLSTGLASGETLGPNEAVDALQMLNEMLEEWSLENMAVWGSVNESFNTIAAQALYTIGPGGNWNTVRPIRIADAYCTFGGVDFPVEIIGQDRYNQIGLKTQQQPIIERLLYVNDDPLGKITLFPVPSAVIPVVLSTDRVISQIATVNTVVAWPPGYAKALRYNLAVALAGDYGTNAPDDVKTIANKSKGKIKVANMPKLEMSFDDVLVPAGPAIWQRGY